MQRSRMALLFALNVTSTASGQGRLDVEHLRARLDRSERLWQDLVRVNGESYTYVATLLRDGGEGREDTEISVDDGVITERVHAYYGANGLIFKWRERQDQLGHHQSGAALRKMGDLYAQCRNEILTLNPADYWLVLDFDQQGLLQRCGSVTAPATSLQPVGINLAWVRFAP